MRPLAGVFEYKGMGVVQELTDDGHCSMHIFWIFLAIWGVQSGSRLGHNFKSQIQVLGTFSWGGGVWGVKTAYCGQDTTPYVPKPLL